jgi:hypothetical protein
VYESYQVILRYEKDHPGEYYWFDPFSLNQHNDTGVVDTTILEKAFGEQIQEIGATLIVASPWSDPAFLAVLFFSYLPAVSVWTFAVLTLCIWQTGPPLPLS